MKRRSGARRRGARWTVACALAAAVCAGAAPAIAQPSPVTSAPKGPVEELGKALVIVSADHVVDLGAATGVA